MLQLLRPLLVCPTRARVNLFPVIRARACAAPGRPALHQTLHSTSVTMSSSAPHPVESTSHAANPVEANGPSQPTAAAQPKQPKKDKKSKGISEGMASLELNPPPEYIASRIAMFDRLKREQDERIAGEPQSSRLAQGQQSGISAHLPPDFNFVPASHASRTHHCHVARRCHKGRHELGNDPAEHRHRHQQRSRRQDCHRKGRSTAKLRPWTGQLTSRPPRHRLTDNCGTSNGRLKSRRRSSCSILNTLRVSPLPVPKLPLVPKS